MPRESRKRSESGVYHIMLRGINKQRIFEDDEDYRRFLETLVKYREECGYSLYGYCLMPNHVHLVLREGETAVADNHAANRREFRVLVQRKVYANGAFVSGQVQKRGR